MRSPSYSKAEYIQKFCFLTALAFGKIKVLCPKLFYSPKGEKIAEGRHSAENVPISVPRPLSRVAAHEQQISSGLKSSKSPSFTFYQELIPSTEWIFQHPYRENSNFLCLISPASSWVNCYLFSFWHFFFPWLDFPLSRHRYFFFHYETGD